MLIQERPLKHWIDNFYGYGSWDARIWFIAHEESGGDLPEEEAEKFNYFFSKHKASKHGTLSDVRDLYRHVATRLDGPRATLFSTFFEYRFGPNAIQHGLWKNLIAFAQGYYSNQSSDLLAYQKDTFLSPAARNEALIPLYPLPTHNHAWYYSWLELPQFPFLKSRALFQEHVYATRMQTILDNIRTHNPKVVMMYGMDNINRLKESVYTFFPEVKFRQIKAVKLKVPQHHLADLNGTKLIITTQIPALRHNRIETGFDWAALATTLRV